MADPLERVDSVARSAPIDRIERLISGEEQRISDTTVDPANSDERLALLERDLDVAQQQLDVLLREELIQRQELRQREDVLALQDPVHFPLDPVVVRENPSVQEPDSADREVDPAQRALDPAQRERSLDQIQREFETAKYAEAVRIAREDAYVPDAVVDASSKRPAGS